MAMLFVCVCRAGGGQCFCVCEGWHQATSSMTLHFIFASWGLKTGKWQVPLPAYLASLSPPDFLYCLSSHNSSLTVLATLAGKQALRSCCISFQSWDDRVVARPHFMLGTRSQVLMLVQWVLYLLSQNVVFMYVTHALKRNLTHDTAWMQLVDTMLMWNKTVKKTGNYEWSNS